MFKPEHTLRNYRITKHNQDAVLLQAIAIVICRGVGDPDKVWP